ncbi:hypothetical protein [Streptomyces chiangmaiensis]|uniref:Uncharacterized protein n=1 Tax=Streptomyces chiangmaiensis TaxID=766497 RepID=A0ABU7FFI9_9ACTN|nr:hypothetical protein [Streptomyces chiangmaiensis]MED7822593.1 hypothetical protein [Streptomyces chiangmaiensis]
MDQPTYDIVYNALWRRGMSHEEADLAACQAAVQMAAATADDTCGAERPGIDPASLSEADADCALALGHEAYEDHYNGISSWPVRQEELSVSEAIVNAVDAARVRLDAAQSGLRQALEASRAVNAA